MTSKEFVKQCLEGKPWISSATALLIEQAWNTALEYAAGHLEVQGQAFPTFTGDEAATFVRKLKSGPT